MQTAQNQIVPDKFYSDFISILPKELLEEINYQKYNLEIYVKENVDEYYSSKKTNVQLSTSSNSYHSNNKMKLYSATLEAFNGNVKHKSMLGAYSEVFKNGLAGLDIKGEGLHTQWLIEIKQWRHDYHSLMINFSFFRNLSKTQQINGLKKDIRKVLIHYVNVHYSGLREFVYNKSTSSILDHNFFGHPKDMYDNLDVIIRGTSKLSYDHVKLFSEHDAKVFNACYHLGFNDLLHSTTMLVDISDVTQYIYGNRAMENKESVIESIGRLADVGYTAVLDNEDLRYSDKFYFFQRISIIQEKRTRGKASIARIVLSEAYREHTLKTLSLSYNQSYKYIPLHTKYSFLLNQYILKVRTEILTVPHIEHIVAIDELRTHINFSGNENIIDVLSSALDNLKESETYLENYEIDQNRLILYIEGVDTSEGEQISMMKQLIDTKLKSEN